MAKNIIIRTAGYIPTVPRIYSPLKAQTPARIVF